MAQVMRFQGSYSHNSRDASSELDKESGRYVDTVRVDRRIGYLLTALSHVPKGASTAALVGYLNRRFQGSGYSENDVRHALLRAQEAGLVTHHTRGVWKLTPSARRKWDSVVKRVK